MRIINVFEWQTCECVMNNANHFECGIQIQWLQISVYKTTYKYAKAKININTLHIYIYCD